MKFKRFLIDLPEDVHEILKIDAAVSGTNIKNHIESMCEKTARPLRSKYIKYHKKRY